MPYWEFPEDWPTIIGTGTANVLEMTEEDKKRRRVESKNKKPFGFGLHALNEEELAQIEKDKKFKEVKDKINELGKLSPRHKRRKI